MTNMELYTRVLTELSYHYSDRTVGEARRKMQDVLRALRYRAAEEYGDIVRTQNEAERLALMTIDKEWADIGGDAQDFVFAILDQLNDEIEEVASENCDCKDCEAVRNFKLEEVD